MAFSSRSIANVDLSFYSLLLVMLLLSCQSTDAYDSNGNITVRWDIMGWTPDGYVAIFTMFNSHQYRQIQSPGWTLEWTWADNEVIWNMIGMQTTEQGDCSKYKGNVPHCCQKNPTVMELLPGTPYNQQFENCCKGGVINSWAQYVDNAANLFQIIVGAAGNTSKTVRAPKNFTVTAPGLGYNCGQANTVKPTRFVTADKRRVIVALTTWNVTCTYSEFLA